MNKLTIGMVEILGAVAIMLSAAALVVIPSAIEEEASAQNANDTNTTAATQNGLDIRDLTGISNIIFLYPYRLLYP